MGGVVGSYSFNPFGRKTKLNISLTLQFTKATSWVSGALPRILRRKHGGMGCGRAGATSEGPPVSVPYLSYPLIFPAEEEGGL